MASGAGVRGIDWVEGNSRFMQLPELTPKEREEVYATSQEAYWRGFLEAFPAEYLPVI